MIPFSDAFLWNLQTLVDCEEFLGRHAEGSLRDSLPAGTQDCINRFLAEFKNSMADDLHTPVLLAALSDPLKTVNDLLHTRKVGAGPTYFASNLGFLFYYHFP